MDLNSEQVNGLENNDFSPVINDIDLPLYKYGLMFRYDINNYFDTDIKKRKQNFKFYAVIIWILVNFLRISICLINVENGRVAKYYFDIIQYIGGLTEFYKVLLHFNGELLVLHCVVNGIK